MSLLPVRFSAFCAKQFFGAAVRRGPIGIGLLLASLAGFTATASAQELRHQRHPLSTYLDLRPAAPGATSQTTPSWIEALEFAPAIPLASTTDTTPQTDALPLRKTSSVFRLRLRHPANASSENLQARVFFQDTANAERPRVSLWNELGEQLLPAVSLGQGLGLPSSETLTLPMHGADYLEIETAGDGSQVRGLFLSWLEPTEVLQPSDFPSKEKVRQPFQILSAARKRRNDSYLYGVVTASLLTGPPVVLKPAQSSTTLQFQLERQPLLAVVTYEVLGAPIDAPPAVGVNGHPLGQSTLVLPDLADPGFRGESREAETRLGFRYTGWLRAQQIIPGDQLVAGLNSLGLVLSNGTDAVAIRSVAIQLKYNWEKLDYVLSASPPDETP